MWWAIYTEEFRGQLIFRIFAKSHNSIANFHVRFHEI